jgi:hypothetical protein
VRDAETCTTITHMLKKRPHAVLWERERVQLRVVSRQHTIRWRGHVSPTPAAERTLDGVHELGLIDRPSPRSESEELLRGRPAPPRALHVD